MDIYALAAARQQKISNLSDSIDAIQAEIAAEQVILDELQRLGTQNSFSMAEINYMIDHSV